MQNGKIKRNERRVSKTITMAYWLEQAAKEFTESQEHKETYKNGGQSLLITHALKAFMGIE